MRKVSADWAAPQSLPQRKIGGWGRQEGVLNALTGLDGQRIPSSHLSSLVSCQIFSWLDLPLTPGFRPLAS